MEQPLRRAITSEDTNDFGVLLRKCFPHHSVWHCQRSNQKCIQARQCPVLLSPIQILMSLEKNVALFSFPFLSEITFWREKATKWRVELNKPCLLLLVHLLKTFDEARRVPSTLCALAAIFKPFLPDKLHFSSWSKMKDHGAEGALSSMAIKPVLEAN